MVLLGQILVKLPVFEGGNVHDLFKLPVKVGYIIKPTFIANIRYAEVFFFLQGGGMNYLYLAHKLRKGHIRLSFEVPAKCSFAQKGK